MQENTGRSQPLISVIIAAFNSEAFIRRALASAFAQTYARTEVVVIDDGSTDRTAEIVSTEFPAARLISQENCGVSIARNAGIAHARGDWVAYLDSDDYWTPDKLERQMEFVSRHGGLRFVTCNHYRVRGDVVLGHTSRSRRIFGQPLEEGVVTRYFTGRARCAFHNSSVLLIHRSLFEQYGEFDPHYSSNEDSEFVMRLALHGEPIGYLDTPLCYYEVGNPNSITKKYVKHSMQFADYWMTAERRYPNADPRILDQFRVTRRKTIINSPVKILIKTGNYKEARIILTKYKKETFGTQWLLYYFLSFLPVAFVRRSRNIFRNMFFHLLYSV